MILAIDCSDKACSIALGGAGRLFERYTEQARQHAQQIKPMYRELLAESGVDQNRISTIAVGAGPGSFTGLRIGFSFAQGLAYALDIPLLSISSLEALAQTALEACHDCDRIEAAFDARMGEIYCASFALGKDGLTRLKPDQLLGAADFHPEQGEGIAAVGSAFALPDFSSIKTGYLNPDASIRASAVLALAEAGIARGETGKPALGAEPAYLRRENAWKTLEHQGKQP